MNKPTLLYASPFPPLASGIADYSLMMVKALRDQFDITLYIDNYEVSKSLLMDLPVLRCNVDQIPFDSFDYRIYNIGNDLIFHGYIYDAALRHPGTVILHDYVLFHFVRSYYSQKNEYYSAVYRKFGCESFAEIKRAAKLNKLDDFGFTSMLPMNEELLRSGNRIIVHSQYTKGRVLGSGLVCPGDVLRIGHISLLDLETETYPPKTELLEKYNIPQDAVLICSMGYIMETKKNREICRAVKKLAEEVGRKLCYVMVGGGNFADEELEDSLIIKTGYTTLEEFNSFIHYADLIINLRWPTLGETSGAMLRILQEGRPCITNNGGWFSEVPDDCVRKIELDDIEGNVCAAILELLDSPDQCEELGRNARAYVEAECSGGAICKNIYDFLTGEKQN